jgi:hypothetical protein
VGPCRQACGAREACCVAPEARYDDLERLYHADRLAGRRALCARFGVVDEVDLGANNDEVDLGAKSDEVD